MMSSILAIFLLILPIAVGVLLAVAGFPWYWAVTVGVVLMHFVWRGFTASE